MGECPGDRQPVDLPHLDASMVFSSWSRRESPDRPDGQRCRPSPRPGSVAGWPGLDLELARYWSWWQRALTTARANRGTGRRPRRPGALGQVRERVQGTAWLIPGWLAQAEGCRRLEVMPRAGPRPRGWRLGQRRPSSPSVWAGVAQMSTPWPKPPTEPMPNMMKTAPASRLSSVTTPKNAAHRTPAGRATRRAPAPPPSPSAPQLAVYRDPDRKESISRRAAKSPCQEVLVEDVQRPEAPDPARVRFGQATEARPALERARRRGQSTSRAPWMMRARARSLVPGSTWSSVLSAISVAPAIGLAPCCVTAGRASCRWPGAEFLRCAAEDRGSDGASATAALNAFFSAGRISRKIAAGLDPLASDGMTACPLAGQVAHSTRRRTWAWCRTARAWAIMLLINQREPEDPPAQLEGDHQRAGLVGHRVDAERLGVHGDRRSRTVEHHARSCRARA